MSRTFTVGDSIGEFARETGFASWNRYASVNYEFVPIHMDHEAGRTAGLPSAIGMGNLSISYLHALLRTWFGHEGTLKSFSAQFRAMDTGGPVTATGEISAVEDTTDGTLVTVDIRTRNAEGKDLAPGSAKVLFAK